MYRPYNGNLYSQGTQVKTICKAHQNDIITVIANMDEGTLSYRVNEEDEVEAFTNLKGKEIYPALAFYGVNRTCSLLNIDTGVVTVS